VSVLGFYILIFLVVGVGSYLQAGVQGKLFQDIVHVALDGVDGEVEVLGDFLVAHALADQRDYLMFAFGHFDCFFKWRKAAGFDSIVDYLGKKRFRQGVGKYFFTFCHCAYGRDKIIKGCVA